MRNNVVLETFDIRNLSMNEHTSPFTMDEASQIPIPIDPQRQEYNTGAPAYFQVTTWLTSLRRSTWTMSNGTHARQETVEQLIGQRTTHNAMDPVAESRDDRDSPQFINNIASQVRFPTWLPSFRRTRPIQPTDMFARVDEPDNEFTGPTAGESWNPQYINSPSHNVGPTIRVDSIQGELSDSPLTGRRGLTGSQLIMYLC